MALTIGSHSNSTQSNMLFVDSEILNFWSCVVLAGSYLYHPQPMFAIWIADILLINLNLESGDLKLDSINSQSVPVFPFSPVYISARKHCWHSVCYPHAPQHEKTLSFGNFSAPFFSLPFPLPISHITELTYYCPFSLKLTVLYSIHSNIEITLWDIKVFVLLYIWKINDWLFHC